MTTKHTPADLDRLFQSLTPGGSEFVDNPENCVAWAKARMDAKLPSRWAKERADLLAACQEWLGLWLYIRGHYPDIELPNTLHGDSDACGRLRAAIAAATGGQP